MNSYKILFSNLGYARGIGGTLSDHLRYAHRHFYCPEDVQQETLKLVRGLIQAEDPDIGCFVEIDSGSLASAGYNQLGALIDERYTASDIHAKYGPQSPWRSFFMTKGKSNAFIAKTQVPHERMYFTHGTKRLIYKVRIADNLTLFFAHFSLNERARRKQLLEVRDLLAMEPDEVIFLGDFNILNGVAELAPLLQSQRLILLNRAEDSTFTFHRRKLLLDLCICSRALLPHTALKIIPQPYSDHSALLVTLDTSSLISPSKK